MTADDDDVTADDDDATPDDDDATPDDDDDVTADDDDVSPDDDDATPDDDDATADDDDDVTADDDDATADDDDATAAPSTTMFFLDPPINAELSYTATFRLQTNGDNPGPVLLTIDGDEIGGSFFGVTSHEAEVEVVTEQYPDGDYTVVATMPFWNLSNQRDVTFANGELLVYDLGPADFDANAPNFVQFTAVSSAVSAQVQISPDPSTPVPLLFGYVLDPNGDTTLGGPTDTQFRVAASGAEPWAGGVPGHPYTPFLPGEYLVYPWTDQDVVTSAILDSQAVVKRSFEPVEAGLLSLDFYFVPGSGLTASTAPSDGNFQDFLSGLEGALLGADIGLGDLRYFDAPATPMVTSTAALADLFRLSVTGTDRALPVFLVQDLDLPNFDVAGVAAHVPGPALASGTGQAGVVFTSELILDGDAGLATSLAAHEIGHFLGLYHTSEIGGGQHDELTDTAQSCDASDCWETNVMDPYLLGSTGISDDQAFVMLRHPLVDLVDPGELNARDAAWVPPPLSRPGGLFCQVGPW